MKINVMMLAFGRDKEVREVDIPDERIQKHEMVEEMLDLVYHYGQNDLQPKQCASVSVGDVIVYKEEKYLVCSTSFRKLTQIEFDQFLKLSPSDRRMNELTKSPNL
jgi:hypothetical protein